MTGDYVPWKGDGLLKTKIRSEGKENFLFGLNSQTGYFETSISPSFVYTGIGR